MSPVTRKRLWIACILSNLIMLMIGAWFVPPKMFPDWTIIHSPFMAQRAMCLEVPLEKALDKGALIRRRWYDTGMVAPSPMETKNDRLLSALFFYHFDNDVEPSEKLIEYIQSMLASSNGDELYRGILLGFALRVNEIRDSSNAAMIRLLDIEPRLAIDALYLIGGARYAQGDERLRSALERLRDGDDENLSFQAKCLNFKSIYFLMYLKKQQEDNGSWGNSAVLTANCVGAFLNLGYDHVAPGKFRRTVENALNYLLKLRGLGLSDAEEAMVNLAICNIYNFTKDEELRVVCMEISKEVKRSVVLYSSQPFQSQELPLIQTCFILRQSSSFSLPGSYLEMRGVDVTMSGDSSIGDRLSCALAHAYAEAPCQFTNDIFETYLKSCDNSNMPLSNEDLSNFMFICHLSERQKSHELDKQFNWFYGKVFSIEHGHSIQKGRAGQEGISCFLPDYIDALRLSCVANIITDDMRHVRRKNQKR